ncbi:MAG: Fe-S cluster assembly protein SufD [Thermogutta sp.]
MSCQISLCDSTIAMVLPDLKQDLHFTAEGFHTVILPRPQPEWARELRTQAFQAFQELPWPNRSMEEWRRTELRIFHLENFVCWAPTPDPLPEIPSALAPRLETAGRIVTLNGRKISSTVESDLLRKGLVIECLEDSLSGPHEELIRQHLWRLFDWRADKFSALHAAFWTGGTFIYVPRGLKVEQPILHVAALASNQADVGHTLIVVDEEAEATVVTETSSLDPGAEGLFCGGIEIFVRPGARLRYVNFQNWNQKTFHFARQKAEVAERAFMEWTLGALGGRLAKVNQELVLNGPESEAIVNGVMFAEDRQHLAYHTRQDHRTGQTKSDLLYKGALQDHAHLVWRGMIRVEPGALRSDGYQRNDNLMLSDTARVDCIPGLEILADDVRCTHGATAGRVDEEEIFYAQTRGLTRREATRLVVTGFFQQVLDRITIDSVRDALGDIIQQRVREYRSRE